MRTYTVISPQGKRLFDMTASDKSSCRTKVNRIFKFADQIKIITKFK